MARAVEGVVWKGLWKGSAREGLWKGEGTARACLLGRRSIIIIIIIVVVIIIVIIIIIVIVVVIGRAPSWPSGPSSWTGPWRAPTPKSCQRTGSSCARRALATDRQHPERR